MNRVLICRAAVVAFAWATLFHNAAADPPDILRNYRFIPSETKVHVTGGSPAYDWNLSIAGRFGLVTGYDEEISPITNLPSLVPHAEFVNVKGILFNPLSLAPLPVPGWDLDKTLNLSGLHGTFSAGQPNRLFFLGADGAGIAIRLEADLAGRSLHLTGGSSDPAGNNPVLYQIDALAHLTPYPDFNGDGAVTSADLMSMMQALTNPTAFKAQHSLLDDDFLSLADVNGDGKVNNADLQSMLNLLKTSDTTDAVPEPAAITLALVGLSVIAFHRRWIRLAL